MSFPFQIGPGTRLHGGDDHVRNVHVHGRALPPQLSLYQFVRSGSTDVSAIVRVYGWDSALIGAYAATIGSTAQTLAQLCGVGSVPSSWAFAELDVQSTTSSAAAFHMETGTVSASSRRYDAPANTAPRAVYVIGRSPVQ
ncbi:MAG: hypothetical protein N2109_12735 [Fimbriimonadales bacterium]|nr:hypothetical protein [Fimbriimonadales bacterium]